jgi:hypothetical protein
VTIQAEKVTRVELELKSEVDTPDDVVKRAITTISGYTETDPQIAEAMKSLSSLEPSKTVAAVASYLDSSTDTVRRSAIYVLWMGKFTDITPAVAGLEKQLGSDDAFTRGMAALALGKNRVASSYDALAKMTVDDPSGYARRCAAISLGWLGDPRAKTVLEAALKDKDSAVRANAKGGLILLNLDPTVSQATHADGSTPSAKNVEHRADGGPAARSVSGDAVKPVAITLGPNDFKNGDLINITEVQASSPELKNGDRVVVKGYYILASQPKAWLSLFATAVRGSGVGPIRPGQQISVTKGQGQFELFETMDCDGYLHVTFYSIPGGKPFGGMYFGTAQQMKEIEQWDVKSWYTNPGGNDVVAMQSNAADAGDSKGGESQSQAGTKSEGDANRTDVVVDGVGWNGFRLGATREELIQAYGPFEPEPFPNSQRRGWRSKRHIDFFFDQNDRAAEVQFMQGFELPLSSGIKIGSSEKDVLLAYGAPDFVRNNPPAKMLEYGKSGVLMWLLDGKVTSFTVIRPHGVGTQPTPYAAQQQAKARERMQQDAKNFSDQERRDIESLYQIANQKWQMPEARDSLKTLVEKYKKANRAGCAILYLGQMSRGDEQIAYFKQAIADHGDCYYGDGVQVGAFARFLLAQVYWKSGNAEQAKVLSDEIRSKYREAVDHQGQLLVKQLPDEDRGSAAEVANGPAVADHAEAEKKAAEAADAWLAMVDQGKYDRAWETTAGPYKKIVTQANCVQSLGDARKSYGEVKSRKLKAKKYMASLPGAPDGQYVVLQYETSFANKQSAVETITPMLDDGQWKVSGYYVK